MILLLNVSSIKKVMSVKAMKILITFFIINIALYAQTTIKIYDSSNSPIDESNLHCLAIDSNQVVWLGSYPHVYQFINGNWHGVEPNIFADSIGTKFSIQDIQVSGVGDVWLTKSHIGTNDNKRIFKYSAEQWTTYNASTLVLEPGKLFIDKNKPWFILKNWWPHQQGFDKIGTLEDSSLKVIDLPWYAGFFQNLIKINNDIYVTAYSDTAGVLKVNGDNWEIIKTGDWRPSFIWEFNNHILLGGEKFCEFDGTQFNYYEVVNSFLLEHNAKVTSFSFENENTFWIGTDKGHLLKIYDGSITISQQFGKGIHELAIDSSKNKWMIIDSTGVLVYNENGIVSAEEYSDKVPSDLLLLNNYPNPFNPSTVIGYHIPKPSDVQLTIFDMLGREIQLLVSEYKSAGNYEAIFNGKEYPSGVYFCRLKADNNCITKKMLMLK